LSDKMGLALEEVIDAGGGGARGAHGG
jgi:hypothetical protein